MDERQGWLLEPTFQRAVKVAASSDRLTSEGRAVLLRETNHRLEMVESLAARFADPRLPDRIRYTLHDPALKLAIWDHYGNEAAKERLSSHCPDLIPVLKQRAHSLRASVRHTSGDGTEARVLHSSIGGIVHPQITNAYTW